LGSFANKYELTFLIYVKKLLGTMGTIWKHIQKTQLFNLVHVEKWPKIFINKYSYGYIGRVLGGFDRGGGGQWK
jgi:hypothetical protein